MLVVFVESSGYFIGFVPEVPGAMSFGKTKDQLMERLKDAAMAIIQYNKIARD